MTDEKHIIYLTDGGNLVFWCEGDSGYSERLSPAETKVFVRWLVAAWDVYERHGRGAAYERNEKMQTEIETPDGTKVLYILVPTAATLADESLQGAIRLLPDVMVMVSQTDRAISDGVAFSTQGFELSAEILRQLTQGLKWSFPEGAS